MGTSSSSSSKRTARTGADEKDSNEPAIEELRKEAKNLLGHLDLLARFAADNDEQLQLFVRSDTIQECLDNVYTNGNPELLVPKVRYYVCTAYHDVFCSPGGDPRTKNALWKAAYDFAESETKRGVSVYEHPDIGMVEKSERRDETFVSSGLSLCTRLDAAAIDPRFIASALLFTKLKRHVVSVIAHPNTTTQTNARFIFDTAVFAIELIELIYALKQPMNPSDTVLPLPPRAPSPEIEGQVSK